MGEAGAGERERAMDVAYEIEATGPAAVLAAIAGLGRTEDIRFSPDGRRLAIACFRSGSVALVDVVVSDGESGPSVEHTGLTVLLAAGLDQPHGVDWLDDRTLVVADRAGRVGLLDAPAGRPGEIVEQRVDLLELDGEFADVYGPGSVTVLARDDDGADVLICNNWGNNVTRTRLERGARWAVADSRIGLQHLLDLPDGVAASDDGAWVAVSNHNRQVVVVYEGGGGGADPDRAPVGVLRGTSFPHGLRFTRDGSRLAVADAGSPFVHLHDRGDDGWSVAGYPAAAVPVLTWEEFRSGNSRPDEGGPKGVELDAAERVLAITCEAVPLRWFDWRAVQASTPPSPADQVPLELAALERESELKAALAQVELRLMETETREHEAQALASRMTERAEDIERRADELSEWAAGEIGASQRAAADAHQRLAAIEGTKLWRSMAPVRRAYASARRRTGRSRGK